MKRMKNNLDEMQEQKLLHLESSGFWLSWAALLLSIIVQMFIYGSDMGRQVLGEWVVFLVVSVYIVAGCIKHGIWDRRLKANGKTNFLTSLAAGLVTGVIMGMYNYRSYGYPVSAAFSGLMVGIFTFLLCIIALSASASAYKKRHRELEEEIEE